MLLCRRAGCRRGCWRVGGNAGLGVQRESRRTVALEKALALHAQLLVAVVTPSLGLSSRRNHRKEGVRGQGLGVRKARPLCRQHGCPQSHQAKGSPEVGRDYGYWNPACQSVSRNYPQCQRTRAPLTEGNLGNWPEPLGPGFPFTSAWRSADRPGFRSRIPWPAASGTHGERDALHLPHAA